MNLKNIFR